MPKLIDDARVDAIKVEENPAGPHRLVHVEGPPELLPITSSLGFFSLGELPYVASGVLDREGIGTNGTGFRYPTDEMDPGEESLEGIEVYNPLGEVQLSIPAFERLMTRYFAAIQRGAEAAHHPVTHEQWWPEFRSTVQKLEDRVAESG